MAITLPAKIAVNNAYLTRIAAGASGTAEINVYQGSMLLGTFHLNHVGSSVNYQTGALTLLPVDETITYVAAGTIDKATVVARDGVVMDDNWPVATGTVAVAGTLVLTTLVVSVGGACKLTSVILS